MALYFGIPPNWLTYITHWNEFVVILSVYYLWGSYNAGWRLPGWSSRRAYIGVTREKSCTIVPGGWCNVEAHGAISHDGAIWPWKRITKGERRKSTANVLTVLGCATARYLKDNDGAKSEPSITLLPCQKRNEVCTSYSALNVCKCSPEKDTVVYGVNIFPFQRINLFGI